VIDGVQVRLGYARRVGTDTEHTVHPLGVVQKRSTWYLVAASDAGLRTYRVDRVRLVMVSGEPVVRPDGFDLAEAWRSVVATVEERRRLVHALVRVSREVLPMLRDQFGDDLSGARPIEDDGFEVEIAAASAEMLADKLAGWSRDVEVLGPDEVRASLARIGAELVARYGSAPARGTT
jgi:predicted DNA-binding transcriptional regulator YafY